MRVGLIGYGYAGKTFHAPLVTAVDGLSLVAVASSNASKVKIDLPEVTVHSDAMALIDDKSIDLVIIATPNTTHALLARAALEAGKHVIIDKPFTLDVAHARELISVAKHAGYYLWVFHNRRWDSDYLTVKAAIEAGTIGGVAHFESKIDRFRPQVRDRWREHAEPGSGIWYDLGPRLIDQALQLFGVPEQVIARTATQRDGSSIEDWVHAILIYGERRVILQATMLAAGGSARFIVHGISGTIVKLKPHQQEAQLLNKMKPGDEGWGEDHDALIIHDANGKRLLPW